MKTSFTLKFSLYYFIINTEQIKPFYTAILSTRHQKTKKKFCKTHIAWLVLLITYNVCSRKNHSCLQLRFAVVSAPVNHIISKTNFIILFCYLYDERIKSLNNGEIRIRIQTPKLILKKTHKYATRNVECR